jgi:hypothetical protein
VCGYDYDQKKRKVINMRIKKMALLVSMLAMVLDCRGTHTTRAAPTRAAARDTRRTVCSGTRTNARRSLLPGHVPGRTSRVGRERRSVPDLDLRGRTGVRRCRLREPLPFMYSYDPIADRYTSNPDPTTGVSYIYDLVTDRFYAYDSASGTYL